MFSGLQNNTLSRADLNYDQGNIKNVHYGDVLIKFGEYIDAATAELPYINDSSIENKFARSLLKDGDIVIADTAEDETVGKCCEITNSDGMKLLSGLHTIAVRPQQKYASKFLGFYLNSNAYHDQLLPLMQGIKVTSISKGALQDTVLTVPVSLDEQSKIGECLSQIDHLITLHQRKCDELKIYKKGLLQQMFPKPGEAFPRVRFPGFTDPWEQRKFGDIAERQSETKISDNDNPSIEYEDIITESGLLNKDVYSKSTRKNGIRFSSSDVLYGKLRPYLHNWFNPDFAGVAVGDWWVLRPVDSDKQFLFRLIQTSQFDDAANQSTNTKMPRADWKLVSNTVFSIPSSIEEQSKIAALFNTLDNLITLHQRKYDELKLYKKGLLQKMFV